MPCVTRSGAERRLPHEALLRAIRDYLERAQGGRCGFCGDGLDGEASFDHIVPVSEGGHGVVANLRLVHLYCNTARNNSLTLVDEGHPRGPWCEYPRTLGPFTRIAPRWTGLPHVPLEAWARQVRDEHGRFVKMPDSQ